MMPTDLHSRLPKIVPPLAEAFTDANLTAPAATTVALACHPVDLAAILCDRPELIGLPVLESRLMPVGHHLTFTSIQEFVDTVSGLMRAAEEAMG